MTFPRTVFLALLLACIHTPAAFAAEKSVATVIHSPHALPAQDTRVRIFLAGSIDMGKSEDWQARVAKELNDQQVVLLNPRRLDWNPAWRAEADEPEFRRQVEWELNALEQADIIVMYLVPGSQSPISLLELGLYARSGKLLIACPEGFWRKGNVDITAERYNIPVYDSLEELIAATRTQLQQRQINSPPDKTRP